MDLYLVIISVAFLMCGYHIGRKMSVKIRLLFWCVSIKLIFFLVSYVFFIPLFPPLPAFVGQSSGIETLVEELCSRLKDLQSKQGKE